jgi:hypothetical protein
VRPMDGEGIGRTSATEGAGEPIPSLMW